MKVLAVILSLFTTAQICVGQNDVKTIDDIFRIKLSGECASQNVCVTSNKRGSKATFAECDEGNKLQYFRMTANGNLFVADKLKKHYRCLQLKKGAVKLRKCKKDAKAPLGIAYNKKTIFMYNSIHRTLILAGESDAYNPDYTSETEVVRFYAALTAKKCTKTTIELWNYMQAPDATAEYNNEIEIEYL